MTSNPSITDRVVDFIHRSAWNDLPAQAKHDTRRALVNFLGTALGGSRDDATERIVATLAAFDGPAKHKVIGRPERLDMLNASFANAASGNVQDFDDTHHPTVIHPTSPVAPPLLALCENRRIAGTDLLHALAIGIEVACRLGNAVTPRHYVHGWHITSTCGVVGAAAGCARILGLDREQTVFALGLAANQACGLVESLGSMAKSVSVGNAARNGLYAALLAQRGFTAAPQTLEGPRGFIQVLGIRPEPEALVDGLGERWEASCNAIKPYPAGVVLHPVIDACLALRSEHDIRPETIRRVVVRGNPLLRQRADRPAPSSGREAAVSTQHSVAVCFLFGSAGIGQYTDACAKEASVRALGANVGVEDDPDMAVESAYVRLELADGSRLEKLIPHALGSLVRPMSDAQINAKVHELARSHGSESSLAPWLDVAWSLETLPDAGRLIALLP